MHNKDHQISTEGQHGPAESQNDRSISARYAFTWRTMGLTANARSIDEMIEALEGAADALRVLQEAGVVLDVSASTGDDACLVTTDFAVAQQFGFTLEQSKEQLAMDASSPGNDASDCNAGK
jgi:hypothetical protein